MMVKYQLPKGFFIDNPLAEMSTAKLTHFQLMTSTLPNFYDEIATMIAPALEASTREAYDLEINQVKESVTAEAIIDCMRKTTGLQGKHNLVDKALTMQEEVVPLILKRLLRSGHATFIENATSVLAYSDMRHVRELASIFKDIRSTYARSATSIVFGVKNAVDYTPLLLEQYALIKQERPDRDYHQGPLLALQLIHGDSDQ